MPDIAERSLHTRIARSVDAIRRSFIDNLFYVTGRTLADASIEDHYIALAYTIRDRMLARLIASGESHRRNNAKTVAYLSAEFLLGPHLSNNILNLKLGDSVREAMQALGLDLQQILQCEVEPGLGNGGLGRLAACYMDSMATLEIPAIGYGIRYEFGMFEQAIKDGWQVEVADAWLRNGNPWELPRQLRYPVHFGGHVEQSRDASGRVHYEWLAKTTIYGVAFDTPIMGYGVINVNLLRLWKSEARESFDLQTFNSGDYYGAVEAMVRAENISKVLYPNDEPAAGKVLRLQQQYFFVSCSLQDMLRLTLLDGGRLEKFDERFVVQLNDTHPAIAIAEFMRLLLDQHKVPWEDAWALTQRSFAYTNHTLLPEALETWEVGLFASVLPRHLQIIFEINQRFLDLARVRFFNDAQRLRRLSLIDEGGDSGVKRIRMAHLACVGSKAINGVASLHSELLKQTTLRDFYDLWPEKFHNKTNGVTPRRFIALANPALAELIEQSVGGGWLRDLEKLRQLERFADDAGYQQQWRRAKYQAKLALSQHVQLKCQLQLDPHSLFDVQVKRIHEYKRQLLNVLHILHLYSEIRQQPNLERVPRSFIFGGKAAPGYHMAKLIIKLINSVAAVVNRDPLASGLIKVAFVPDFNVKTAQHIYPAADLSEQISTAGKEASGTGNMKFTMNGALTIGTLDGANIEIRAAVGEENFFSFGHTVESLQRLRDEGYRPYEVYRQNQEIRDVIELLRSGLFSHGDPGLFQPIINTLLNDDYFMVLADFAAYAERQRDVSEVYRDEENWTRKSILNVARSGYFSSDRAIQEYNRDVWQAPAQAVVMDNH